MHEHDRKIAAILAADVVGYSRLMGADEESTLAALMLRRSLFDRTVAGYGGRDFGSIGDSLMAEFPSAVNAVRCAQAIQQAIAIENGPLAPERRMQLRIGVNLGDVIEEHGALFGDSVNVAARLQALATPGGVLISGAVYEQVRNKLAARFIDAGERPVKNISQPVRTFEVLPTAAPGFAGQISEFFARVTSWRMRRLALGVVTLIVAIGVGLLWREISVTRTALGLGAALGLHNAEPAPRSIAVLPLVNMSGDAGQEYFVAGMYEALITDLSKINALRVISRTSASVFQGTHKTLPEIGRELAVANVIEGSVFRVKDQVRITVQLINAATDQHIWAESYDRNIADVLTLQRELAGIIARQVAATITPDEARRLAKPRPVDPATYEAYLRGMFYLNQFTEQGTAKGLAYLKEAVARDPADPLAYAGLALGYIEIGHGTGPHESFPLAKAAVLKALELDPDLAEAHAALAEIRLYYDWDWQGAEDSFKRALRLNPSLDFSHAHYSWLLQITGRVDEGFAQMKEAERLSPLMPTWNEWLAWQYLDAGRYQQGLAEARRSLELSPDLPWGLFILGTAQAFGGQFDAAIATQQRATAAMPELKWGLGQAYARAGRRDEALKIASQLAKNPGPKDLIMLGSIYGLLGEKDEALKWIQAAYEARVDWFPWIANPTLAASLRGDPRFEEIVGRLGLPKPRPAAP